MKKSINVALLPVLQTDWFTVEQLHTYVLAYISCKIKSCKDASARTSHKARQGMEKNIPKYVLLKLQNYKKIKQN